MEKVCIYCGTTYNAKSKKSKYCCEKCKSKYKYYNMQKYNVVCKYCGKEFNSHRPEANFCSKRCASCYQKNSGYVDLYKIAEFINKNPQTPIAELSSKMGISQKTVYRILNENGYHSYMEFVGVIKGVYIEKQRSDTSLSALKCFELFSKVIGEDYVLEKSFDGLYNPKTNYKLRIDCYFPLSNIAIEYNGIQHYKYIPFFHTKENSLEYQQYKDNLKSEYCKNNNIKLVVVKYDDDLTFEKAKCLLSRDNQQPNHENTDKSIVGGSTTNA